MPAGWIAPTTSSVLRSTTVMPLLRVGGQRQIPCKWRLGPDQLLYELAVVGEHLDAPVLPIGQVHHPVVGHADRMRDIEIDRKSTRLNSSHLGISYAVFCLKKKNNN